MSELSKQVANRRNEELTIGEFDTLDLTNCDREPIHIPGAIQPHGLLLVLTEPDLHIVQVSQNSREIVGIAPEELLDRPLENFIDSQQLDAIHGCIDRHFENINPLPLTWATRHHGQGQSFNGIVHRATSGEIVLELERFDAQAKQDFFQFSRQIKDNLAKIQTTDSLGELCDLIVQQIKQITGFDRVMVYRFDDRGNGSVIAEAKKQNLAPFLGLHYPASDIPIQARQLYRLNWLRLIPDINYEPSQLLTSCRDAIYRVSTLDMSYCVLRSVSSMHIEYLQNMGVSATMTLSLMQGQKLWGLIACHHNIPKFVPYEIRTVCELLGQLMSTELAGKEANENLDYKLQLKDIQKELADRLNGAMDFAAELMAVPELLLKLTGAYGAAVCEGNEIVLMGQTPDKEQVTSLLSWLRDRLERDLFVTDTLSNLYPEAATYKKLASGLLAVAISNIQERYVLWFRPELVHTVTWAGNPDVPTRVEEDGSLTLSPRQSFAAWQETVRGKSRPWLSCEVDGAIELRQAIVDIELLRQANKLAQINLELERSNSELDSFAYIASHDLKEPLRGIHNYATFLLEDYENILQTDGADKLNTMVRLTKRMEALIESLLKFSRLGRQELATKRIDLNQLLHDTIELFQINSEWSDCSIRIPKPLPTVWGDRVLVEEIFSNLISNGFKYNKNEEKWVEIGCDEGSDRPNEMVTFYIRDNGIGIRPKHLESVFRIFKRLHPPTKYGGGTGAGLTIVKKIVERHGGTIQVESIYGQGTTFWFTLPKNGNPVSSLPENV